MTDTMFPHRLDLPGGAWADIRSPREVTRKARKPIRSAWRRIESYRAELDELSGRASEPPLSEEEAKAVAASYVLSDEEVELYDAVNEPLTVAMVKDWSFSEPITVEGLNSLPADPAEELILFCVPYLTDVFIDTETASVEEGSPT